MHETIRYVALGDSFTEGVGDDLPGGAVRGWADRVASGLALAAGGPIEYANLAIRGRLLDAIIAEQLQPALDLGPTIMTFNGGGNDILRPGADLARLIDRCTEVFERVAEHPEVRLIMLSGGNPTRGLPMRSVIEGKGNQLSDAVRTLAAKHGVPYADNWSDPELTGAQYWSHDRLHLNAIGHTRVAARVLRTMGFSAPESWQVTAPSPDRAAGLRENAAFYGSYVLPWIGRRITRRSSGDGRTPKFAQWYTVTGETADSR